jgi:hypothetical protein
MDPYRSRKPPLRRRSISSRTSALVCLVPQRFGWETKISAATFVVRVASF